jgi:hypothetical protein
MLLFGPTETFIFRQSGFGQTFHKAVRVFVVIIPDAGSDTLHNQVSSDSTLSPITGDYRPQGIRSTYSDKGFRQYLRGGTKLRCFPRPADQLNQSGSSLQLNMFSASCVGCFFTVLSAAALELVGF